MYQRRIIRCSTIIAFGVNSRYTVHVVAMSLVAAWLAGQANVWTDRELPLATGFSDALCYKGQKLRELGNFRPNETTFWRSVNWPLTSECL